MSKILRAACLTVLYCLFSLEAGAADKLVADYGGLSGFQSTVWVAKDLKIFDKHI